MSRHCPYDPRPLKGMPIGMYHCPVCGQMVIAGMEHPDYSLLDEPPREEKTDEPPLA